MTHQEENPVVDHVMTLLIDHGPAAMASAFAMLMNLAIQIERQQALKADSHQRTDDRRGCHNRQPLSRKRWPDATPKQLFKTPQNMPLLQ